MRVIIDIPDVPKGQEIVDVSMHFIDGHICECTYPFAEIPEVHETQPSEEMDQFMDDVLSAVQKHFMDGQSKNTEYQRGYEDGRKSNEVTLTTDGTITVPSQSVLGVAAMAIADDKMGYKHGYDDGYQRGLDDMRDALLAISKWGNYYKKQIFHGNYDAIPILRDHEAKYIVDEARRYQEEQAEAIKVGDEVRKIDLDYDCRVVVTSLLAEDKADTMNFQGCHYQILLHEWEKTGRTFPEIAEVLDKLKGGAE